MAVRRALTIQHGQVQELSGTDGIHIGILPLADNSLPDLFAIRQAGEWRMATFAQLQYWLKATPEDEARVKVNQESVTVNGMTVYVNWEFAQGQQVRVDGVNVTVDGLAVVATL